MAQKSDTQPQHQVLYYGRNQYGYLQYYLDEKHDEPACPVTFKPYTNTGEGLVSEEGAKTITWAEAV